MNYKSPFLVNRQIRPGWFLYIEGDGVFTVLEPRPDTRLILPVRNCKTLEEKEFQIAEIEDLSKRCKIPPIFAPSEERLYERIQEYNPDTSISPVLRDDDRSIENAKLYIEKYETIESVKQEILMSSDSKYDGISETEAINEAVKIVNESMKYKKGISKTSYYRIRKLIEKSEGDIMQLASLLHRSTYQQTRLSATTLHFMDTILMRYSSRNGSARDKNSLWEIARQYYLHTKGYWIDPGKTGDIPMNLVEELLKPNIPIEAILANQEKKEMLSKFLLPCRSKFFEYRMWFQHNPDQSKKSIIERYGKNFYENQMQSFDTFVYKATLPLQHVFADHCLLDIFIVDEETRKISYRVWLTLFIDTYSRCILGMALFPDDPCIESIQSALMHSIWSKDKWLEELDIDLPDEYKWECYGIPQTLSLDNAWAHHSHSLENLCRRISFNNTYSSINLRFRPPYKAEYGGLIERYFGNLQLKIKNSLIPGSIYSHTHEGIRNSLKDACLIYEDLQKQIVKFILSYMYHPHSELNGMTPIEKWREGFQAGFPMVPPRNEPNEKLFWRSSQETRLLHQQGIALFGMIYSAPSLNRIPRIDNRGKKIKYSFSYDPNDISRIALFDADKYICDLRAKQLLLPDNSLRKVSLLERDLAKQISKSKGYLSKDWIYHLDEISKISSKRINEKKEINKVLNKEKKEKNAVVGISSNRLVISDIDNQLTKLLTDFSK